MARKDLSRVDAALSEQVTLDYILEKENKSKDTTKYVPVEEAIKAAPVFEAVSTRDETRILFISQDETLLNPTKQSLDGFINLADLFDEVHILILRQGIPPRKPVLRLSKNMWLYIVSDYNWWKTPFLGRKLVKEQLVFADGFRPDIIVARDPYESAYLANKLGEEFGRPVQVHVLEDYTKPDFVKTKRSNYWRRFLAKYNLSKSLSIRTATRSLYTLLGQKFSDKNIEMLPRFHNYKAIMETPASNELKEKYPNMVFSVLYVGNLNHDSMVYKAIDAARFGLRSDKIGMFIVGDGGAKKEFMERTKVLGIDKQVIFDDKNKNDLIYLKSASVLIVPDTTPVSEDLVLKAAAAGIPMILAKTDFRNDVFVDGESALICDADAIDDFSLRLNMLMNDFVLRKSIAAAAQDIIKTRFHENIFKYQTAYRKSIEDVLFLNTVNSEDKKEEAG
jgi:glycosyltransferase involved in cell wall biosynthesis